MTAAQLKSSGEAILQKLESTAERRRTAGQQRDRLLEAVKAHRKSMYGKRTGEGTPDGTLYAVAEEIERG